MSQLEIRDLALWPRSSKLSQINYWTIRTRDCLQGLRKTILGMKTADPERKNSRCCIIFANQRADLVCWFLAGKIQRSAHCALLGPISNAHGELARKSRVYSAEVSIKRARESNLKQPISVWQSKKVTEFNRSDKHSFLGAARHVFSIVFCRRFGSFTPFWAWRKINASWIRFLTSKVRLILLMLMESCAACTQSEHDCKLFLHEDVVKRERKKLFNFCSEVGCDPVPWITLISRRVSDISFKKRAGKKLLAISLANFLF